MIMEQVEKKIIDESQVIQTIIVGSDWQEVLTTLVAEEGMDPLEVDIVKLADAFTGYLQTLQKFDFRVPARFILVAAILLRMKAELLLEEEEEKILRSGEKGVPLDIENIPSLLPPITRKPTKKVTLIDLVSALNKAFEFQEKKEGKTLRMRRAIERLIVPEEDIEIRIKDIYGRIEKAKEIDFSDLVPAWKKLEIVKTFLPVLHLSTRGAVELTQEDLFKEIHIKVKEKEAKVGEGTPAAVG